MKSILVLFSATAMLCAQSARPGAAPSAAPTAGSSDPVVIRVGAESIKRSEFERFVSTLPERLRQEANGPKKRELAQQYAELLALSSEARKRGIDKKPEVKQQIELQTDNILAGALIESKVDQKELDAAMHAYYDQHKAEYNQTKASHILIRFQGSRVPLRPGEKDLTDAEALAKAQAIRKRLVAGEDFAKVAKTESDDTGSGAQGGVLPPFSGGQMVPEFENAAKSLPLNTVSEPIKTMFGYHLILVQERGVKTFDDTKAENTPIVRRKLSTDAVEEVKKQTPIVLDDTYFGKATAQ